MEDTIDPVAGITLAKKIGDAVAVGETIATIYTDTEGIIEGAASAMIALVRMSDTPPEPRQACVLSLVDSSGVQPWRHKPLF